MSNLSQAQILENLSKGKCSVEDAEKQLANVKVSKDKQVIYKVSPKGGVQFNHIRRYPITLYIEELRIIMSLVNTPEFEKFVADNTKSLSEGK
jgi:hypothetical protein